MTTRADDPNLDFHLSAEQIAFYDDNGYLVLPGRIPADLLARLRDAGDRWIAAGRDLDGTPEGVDYAFADRPSGRVMFRVDYVHDKGEPSSLELLGSPEILGIAESLAGRDFVPTYESMVFKDDGDAAPIHWHQDAVHPRHSRIFNVDIYLDASVAGAGALRVVPGSHRQAADICALEEGHGWDLPGAIEVPLEAGDVLIHDVMIVHGSAAHRGQSDAPDGLLRVPFGRADHHRGAVGPGVDRPPTAAHAAGARRARCGQAGHPAVHLVAGSRVAPGTSG